MKNIFILLVIGSFMACQSKKDKMITEINSCEKVLFNDSVKTLNTAKAEEVYRKYIEFADGFKDDTVSAAYLFKAGDIANGLHHPKEAIEIYERLRTNYPDYRKSAAALFMQGFIYETQMQDKDKAKEKYREFIQKYPDHKLTPSAQASLDQLTANISDEELIKQFEQQQQAK